MTTIELTRFFNKVTEQADGCWRWNGATGGKKPHLYGIFKSGGEVRLCHRLAYEHFIGPIPRGMVQDHLCEMKLCVNPSHLRIATQRDNLHASSKTLNSQHALLTHCKNGHLLSEDNIRMYRSQRVCKACKGEWVAKKRQLTDKQ